MEDEDIQGVVVELNGKLDDILTKNAELRQELDFLRKRLNESEAKGQRPSAGDQAKLRKSIGKLVVEALQKRIEQEGEPDLGGKKQQILGFSTKGAIQGYRKDITTTDGAGGLVDRDVDPEIALTERYREVSLRDLIPFIPTTQNAVKVTTRIKRSFLKTTVAVTLASGNTALVVDNAAGVVVGSTLTLSEGTVREEDRIVDSVDLATNTITFTAATGNDHNKDDVLTAQIFSFVAECAKGVEFSEKWTDEEIGIKNLRAFVKLSAEALQDAPRLQSEIEMDLEESMDIVFDDQALNGDGTGDNFEGIISNAEVPTIAWSAGAVGDTRHDVIRRGAAQAHLSDRKPEIVVISPMDSALLDIEKGNDGHYLKVRVIGPGGEEMIWRLRVIETTALATGKFVVGNFSRGARVYQRLEFTVEMSNSDQDDFVKYKVTIRVVERLGFHVREPKAFVVGTWDSAPA